MSEQTNFEIYVHHNNTYYYNKRQTAVHCYSYEYNLIVHNVSRILVTIIKMCLTYYVVIYSFYINLSQEVQISTLLSDSITICLTSSGGFHSRGLISLDNRCPCIHQQKNDLLLPQGYLISCRSDMVIRQLYDIMYYESVKMYGTRNGWNEEKIFYKLVDSVTYGIYKPISVMQIKNSCNQD